MKREYLTARFDVTELDHRQRELLALSVVVQSEPDKDEFDGCEPPELEWDEVEDDPGDHVDSDRPPGTSGSWGEA